VKKLSDTSLVSQFTIDVLKDEIKIHTVMKRTHHWLALECEHVEVKKAREREWGNRQKSISQISANEEIWLTDHITLS
jgi:hypothetical protein